MKLLLVLKDVIIAIAVIGIVIIILKVMGVINWTWAWVLSPLWIGVSTIGIMIGIIYLIARGSN